jgi:hypothetical protein
LGRLGEHGGRRSRVGTAPPPRGDQGEMSKVVRGHGLLIGDVPNGLALENKAFAALQAPSKCRRAGIFVIIQPQTRPMRPASARSMMRTPMSLSARAPETGTRTGRPQEGRSLRGRSALGWSLVRARQAGRDPPEEARHERSIDPDRRDKLEISCRIPRSSSNPGHPGVNQGSDFGPVADLPSPRDGVASATRAVRAVRRSRAPSPRTRR